MTWFKTTLKLLPLLIILCVNPFYGLKWSKNHVLKYNAAGLSNFTSLIDYENLFIDKEYIHLIEGATKAWLRTEEIDIGQDFVLSSAFINFKSPLINTNSSNNLVLLKVLNSDNDELIEEKWFSASGKIDIINRFEKQVNLVLEILDPTVQLASFGLVRQPEVVLQAKEAEISPIYLYYTESLLKIVFQLHFPATLDIILFDNQGRIIDHAAKKQFFQEGWNYVFWDPELNGKIKSGNHQIYFKALSTDNKLFEITKPFYFIKD